MHLNSLSLTNFRNYSRLDLEFPPGVVVLQGENAQGKTNLLEAIHILATTRSPRAGTDRELMNWMAFEDVLPYARIVAKVRRGSGYSQIEMTASTRENDSGIVKKFKINGAAKRAFDVIGYLTVVLFSPLDIDLIAGSPSERRRFLDIMNSQVDHGYLRSLQQYNRVLAQRNALLRLIREGQANIDQLDYWNEQLVQHGAAIITARRTSVTILDELIGAIHPEITGRQETLRINYISNAATSNDDVSAQFHRALRAISQREAAQGVSLVGPHRDDLAYTTNDADTAVYGSRGQQRTAALALKLAETEYIHQKTGEYPVLLLDDVMSELDYRRRRQVVATIKPGQQVIITATDLEDFEPSFLSRVHLYRVKAGSIDRTH